MNCKDCNFYDEEKRICIKTERFEFPSMPACDKFKENKD